MNIIYLGIDLAKNVFQLCGLNQASKPVYKNALIVKRYYRPSRIFRPA